MLIKLKVEKDDRDFHVLGPERPRSTVSSTIDCFASLAIRAL
jgi:hypothetical protein